MKSPEENTKNSDVKYCEFCQKDFFPKKSWGINYMNKIRFCCKSCAVKSRGINQNPKYGALHMWLSSNYIKKKTCDFCHKTTRRIEWALKRGKKYERKIENYFNLCVSCHRKYDITEEFKEKCRRRGRTNPFNGNQLILKSCLGKIRGLHPASKRIKSLSEEGKEEYFESLSTAQDLYGYKISTLSMCLTGKLKTAYGKKWIYI